MIVKSHKGQLLRDKMFSMHFKTYKDLEVPDGLARLGKRKDINIGKVSCIELYIATSDSVSLADISDRSYFTSLMELLLLSKEVDMSVYGSEHYAVSL